MATGILDAFSILISGFLNFPSEELLIPSEADFFKSNLLSRMPRGVFSISRSDRGELSCLIAVHATHFLGPWNVNTLVANWYDKKIKTKNKLQKKVFARSLPIRHCTSPEPLLVRSSYQFKTWTNTADRVYCSGTFSSIFRFPRPPFIKGTVILGLFQL